MSRNRHSKNRRNQTSKKTTNTAAGRTTSGQRAISRGTSSGAMTRTSAGLPSEVPSSSSALASARKSLESIGTSALELASGALKTVKENPMPFALAGAGVVCAGAGLTWYLMSHAKSAMEDAGEGAARGARSMPAMPAMPAMKDIGGSVKKATRAAGERASQLAHDALESGKKLEQSVEDVVREHPIAVGAALLATGAAIGLAIPRTSLEDGWLGRERDHLVSSAQQLAKGAVQKVESFAKQASGGRSGNNVAHA